MITKLFKILIPLLIYAFGRELFATIQMISFADLYQKIFFIALGGGFLLTTLFVKAHGYLAILAHELTHNTLGVLTFNKPVGLNVEANMGGVFVFKGKHNILSVLSPYFFPLITVFIFPIYFILASSGAEVYFGLLGVSLGFSFSIGIRQAHRNQPDLQVFGLVWSYLIILFFQIFIFGMLISFVIGRMSMLISYVTMSGDHIVELYEIGKALVMMLVDMVKE
ncbi:MAG: hypothetical protein ACEPOZ_06185 [Marinifilaceae bacterium]